MVYNVVAKNFYSTMKKISVDKKKKASKEDLMIKKFWWKDCLTNIDSWIAFYYQYGRFPGSENFTNVPQVNTPIFLKTETILSPPDLYQKFAGTDAKGLVSLHVLAALNIYFGGNQLVSQTAFGGFMTNLTYRALSDENDNIFLSFEESINLADSIVNTFADIENSEFEIASQISDKISDKLHTQFEIDEIPAVKIQLGEEESIVSEEPKPVEFSTPLKLEEINEIYDREKTDYSKIAMKLNQTDLELASEVADSENETLIQEITNPIPGLVVGNDINIDMQFSFKNSDLDTSFALSNTLKSKLDNILDSARNKIS